MEKFIVSARKYRPQNFSTVVGQEHITTTLKNAIRNNQVAHAFLFCGPRGVGKTTCARILAKTINCENLGKNAEACNKCQSCISFNDGASLNIHELDAASNNSVDDIRSLVEQVRFAPQAGKYKVYIIDEVHMLTSSAFNAFLKTLEEPPSFAIFILATTEKHKIIPTILSRCQIFDFKRITINDLVLHLQEICNKEEIHADKTALQVIAQKSEGCMRDALSILDKIVSFTNGQLSYQNTVEHLNILDADYYFKLIDAMMNQDLSSVLLLYDDINSKGFEGDLVLEGFSEFLRNLLVCKDERVAGLLEVVESFKDKYMAAAKTVSPSYIISALNVLNDAEVNYKAARNKRLHVELALIKICYLQQALELTASENAITKKKLTDAVVPLAFRNLTVIEVKDRENRKTGKQQETKQVQGEHPGDGDGKAKLIIERGVSHKTADPGESVSQRQEEKSAEDDIPRVVHLGETITEKIKSSPAKVGVLDKIRQQYSNTNGTGNTSEAKSLTVDELQKAWSKFAAILREDKKPAAQSFERAELRVVDNNLFEVIIGNNLEQKFIEQQRLWLCEHIQNWFNNKKLTYHFLIREKADQKHDDVISLNSREQYQRMIEQYPLVKELKDRLRMELDY